MATIDDVEQALLDKILECVEKGHSGWAREYAEAYAWLQSPAQPHGGNTISR